MDVAGFLMMAHMNTPEKLAEQAKLMESYGAMAIVIMDSTGTYMPIDVFERITELTNKLSVPVGFHGHNNLQMAIINSLMAVQGGATIIDACIRGFGAGAGNAALEVLIPVFGKFKYSTNIDFNQVIMEADRVMEYLIPSAPITAPINILTGLNRLFSGFEKPIIKASKLHGVEYSSLIFELGNRKLVAGQEDLILQVAESMKK
jgi:4-hydroxy 2-oxovalerate aldolase